LDSSATVIFSNLAIAVYSIGPPLFVLLFYKRFPFGYWKQLIYGLLLIGWSMVTFSFFSGVLDALEGVEMSSESLKESILSSVNLWVYAYPAIVLSVGANFIAQFFMSWDAD
jgi:hypothetical protein